MHHLLTGVSFSLFTNFFLLTHQHSLYIMPSSTLSQPKHHQHNAVQYNIMEACSIHNAFLYIISMQPIICHIIYVQYISCKINGLEFMIFIFLLLIFHSDLPYHLPFLPDLNLKVVPSILMCRFHWNFYILKYLRSAFPLNVLFVVGKTNVKSQMFYTQNVLRIHCSG